MGRRTIVGFFLLLVILTGCSRLGLGGSSMSFDAVYPAPNQSDVTVHYTLLRPPQGKVYVLWILNPFEGKVARAGALDAGHDLTAHAQVDFAALGAVVSIEKSGGAATMSGDWAAKAGQVTPDTPTPSPIDLTPTATPGATPPSGSAATS